MSINSENSSLNNKSIYDYTSFTHLDYPNHLACIVWFSGCNMRCDYCYNKSIVYARTGKYSYEDVLDFLKSRIDLLDAVVLSGGEATSHDLVEFCQAIKELGFKIKLDTNGTYYNNVKELLELDLLDYVALDYKAPKEKFKTITHSNRYDEFSKSLNMLINSSINYEVRSTIHNDLLNVDDVNSIIKDLKQRGYSKTYYLQEFLDTEDNIGDIEAPISKFDKSQLIDDLEIVFR